MNRLVRERRGRPGFTLIEMLVAMAILSLVFLLIFPALQSIRESGNRVQCVNNLRQVSFAYNGLRQRKVPFRSDGSWVQQLLPIAENNKSIFLCPSDARAASGRAVPDGYIRVRNRTFAEYGGTHDIKFEEKGPRCRLSQAVPQSASGTYGMEIEDSVDWDFNDLILHFEPQATGDMKIAAIGQSRSYRYDLLDGDKRVVVADYGPPKVGVIPGGASRTSYAINNAAKDFRAEEGGTKVLAVEYRKVVARVVGSNAGDFWPRDSAPRHRNLMNVAYTSGQVLTLSPDEIDPRNSSIYNENWLPAKLRATGSH